MGGGRRGATWLALGSMTAAACGRIGFDTSGAEPDAELADPTAFTKLFSGPGYDFPRGLTKLPSRAVVITGSIQSPSIDFGGGPVPHNGNETTYAASFDPAGNHLWSVSQTATTLFAGFKVATNPAGGALAVGAFGGTAEVGGTMISTTAGQHSYLVGIDGTAGAFADVVHFGGSDSTNMQAYAVAAAPSRRAFGGGYGTAVSFASGVDLPPPVDFDDGWIAVLDDTSTPVWATGYLALGQNYVYAAAFDVDEHLCVVGDFSATLDTGTGMLTPVGGVDGFVALYAPDGSASALIRLGSPGFDAMQDCVGLASGGFVVAGIATGAATLGTKPLAAAAADVVVARVERDGSVTWARTLGGTGNETTARVAIGTGGRVYVGASFEGTMTVGAQNLVSNGRGDLFFAELDLADGTPLRGWSQGGAANELVNGLVVDGASGDVVATGTFEGATNIGGEIATAVFTDIYLYRFSPP